MTTPDITTAKVSLPAYNALPAYDPIAAQAAGSPTFIQFLDSLMEHADWCDDRTT